MKFFKLISKKLTSVMIAIFILSSGIAVAENPTNITVSQCDDENRVVTVSGNVATSRPDGEIVIMVLKKGVALDTFENTTAENISEVLNYYWQKPLEADGSFSFSFKLAGETGDYVVLINSNAVKGTYSTTLSFTNTLWDELDTLKTDTTDGALQRFRSFIESESTSLMIGMTEYNQLSDEAKNTVCDLTKAFGAVYDGDTFAEEWEKAVIWTFTDENKNNSSAVVSMIDNKIKSGSAIFSDSKFEFYSASFPETIKTALCDMVLSNVACNNLDSFVQLLKDNLLVAYVHNTAFWKDLYTVIEAENNPLGFNSSSVAAFNTLNNKDAVVSALYTQGQNLNTSAEIIGLFDTLVSAQEMAESTPAPTQTPRPSKGNGGSWSVGAPVVAPTPTPTPSVSPEPVKPAEPSKPEFNDIDSVEWAAEAIEYLSEKGIISGVGDGKFEPNRPMTREELVKMLDNAFGYSKEEAESNFADADRNAWYYNAISAAAQKGIINGYADNTFGIGKQITREDAAVIFFRAAGSEKLGSFEEPEFSDSAEISDYAKEAVGVMNRSGIISGMGNGMFMPKNSLTRAEAAKMFYGLLMHIGA